MKRTTILHVILFTPGAYILVEQVRYVLRILHEPDGITILSDPHNYLGVLIPVVYIVIGYLIIFIPLRRKPEATRRWPVSRFVLIVLWGCPRQIGAIMCGQTFVLLYHQICLVMDALIVGRFLLAWLRRDETDDWRIWSILFLFVPILVEMILLPMYLGAVG